jgi:hypothetical protein
MQKFLSSFLIISLYFSAGAFFSYADKQPPTPVEENAAIKLNDQDMERIFYAEELVLKKIKAERVRQERKQHIQDTDREYQEAVSLYRLQQPDQAKEVFSNVKSLTPYYKSTDVLLKAINDQPDQGVKQKPSGTGKAEDPQQAIDLAQQASMLYHQASNLGDNGNTAGVKKKLTKLMLSFQQKSKQIYVQQQMKRIAQEADRYEQEIFKLTQAKDYAAARRKYIEFQQVMIDEFTRVKQTIARVNSRYKDEEKNNY